MPLNNMSYVAGEDLAPCRFVKRSTTEDNTVVYADDGAAAIVGITFNGTRAAPIPSVSEALCAADGEGVRVFGPGDRAEVELGETITAANLNLTATTDGKAVAATSGNFVGAIAERAGSSGERVWVQVTQFDIS
jgi:hypothetical protein